MAKVNDEVLPFNDVNDYFNAPALNLPWHSRRRDFHLSTVDFNCPCGERLVELRGYVYDDEGAVRLDVAGVCLSCRVVVTVYLVIHPEKNVALLYRGNGKWSVYNVERVDDGKKKLAHNAIMQLVA